MRFGLESMHAFEPDPFALKKRVAKFRDHQGQTGPDLGVRLSEYS